ncbi:MAG TPA: cytochrome c [Vicinamibacterales bacterium]|jgi:S-disulfanyl-L-cysteine oxidoreductase SoxD|nr:cytochrome c [Vicinamibacterales bacterium]
MRSMLRAMCALFLGTVSTVVIGAQEAKPTGPTVWDGVYTDAQADRAAGVFSQSCERCHTLTSQGTRPLSGDKFWEGYTQKTVGDLLNFVKTNMPNGQGGSLPAPTYNDLVALILKSNGFPAGKTEVTPETVANVQIIPKDGPGELPNNTLVRVVGCLAPKSGADWTLTSATAPQRIEKTGPVPEDATRPLGDRTVALKFVLNRLDTFVGQRMSVTGILIGAGGVNGINVATVNRVAEACP